MEVCKSSAELQEELIIELRCAEKGNARRLQEGIRADTLADTGNPHTLLHYYTGQKNCGVVELGKDNSYSKEQTYSF